MIRTKICKPGRALAAMICFMFGLNTSQAQVLPGLQNNFTAWQKANLQEKIYVHTDKNFYLTGEILWFKIYNTDGSSNKMLDLSKVVYYPIIQHNAIMQAKIALNQGAGSGSFYIPFSLSNGNYQLRAYTNWMKNFEADYFFQKQITIVNPVKPPDAQPIQQKVDYDVQFFPEGGHLVKGLGSKIAFKITGTDGKGLAGTGIVINQQNDTVARFKSLKFGIGSFTFTPLPQTTYKAAIKVNDALVIKELPEVNESGYVMHATDHDGTWDVAVQGTDSKQSSVLYLIVHNRHAIKSAESAQLVNGTVHFNVDKRKLDEGISYFTLFDDQQRPISERLIFKRPDRKLVINANVDDQLYSTRKKVSLTISTHDKSNKNLPANLSVSVFRADSLQKENTEHIAGYLWLSGDIKGHIESPDYYLEQNNEEGNQALDNLMLSQGWTQFDWTKILAGDTHHFSFIPEYTGPVITGNLVNTLTNKPAPNIIAYLTIAGNHQLYTAKSDSTGRLLFNTKNFCGLNEIITQTKWGQDSTYRVDIVSPFSEQYSPGLLPPLNLGADLKNVLISNSLNMQVQNIFAAKQLKQFSDPVIDSVLFYGKPTYTYKLDDYTRFTAMQEVIHEYVRLMGVTSEHGKLGIRITTDNKTMLPGQPLVMLDGKPIFDVDKAFSIDPLKVKKLDVVSTKYIYGPAIFNGVLNFTTYSGLSTNIELDPRAVVLDYEGLQLQRKFYSPVYDSAQQTDSSIPDFRNVLYWNPKADTDPLGQNKLTFYTSDKPGQYIVIIEGIAQGGEAGSKSFIFEVRK